MKEHVRMAPGRAFLKAGNHHAARREALAVLEENPADEDALELLHQILLAECDWKGALKQATDWVAAAPQSIEASRNLVAATLYAKGEKAARSALERHRRAFWFDVMAHAILNDAIQMTSKRTSDALEATDRWRKRSGDDAGADTAEAFACLRLGRWFAARAAAERALAMAPRSADAIRAGALAAYRIGLFGYARQLARRLREVEPEQSAIANNIIFASYIAVFPPFLWCHLALIAVCHIGLGRGILGTVAGAMVLVAGLAVLEEVLGRFGEPWLVSTGYLSMVAWFFYNTIRFPNPLFKLPKRKRVRLSRGY